MSLHPIKVYKILTANDDDLHTPFQQYSIQFINDKCILSSKLGLNATNRIYEGIHAFIKFDSAKDITQSCVDYYTNNFYGMIYEAEIPPFTRYFIGVHDDIVAKKMIIKNVFSYKYFKTSVW